LPSTVISEAAVSISRKSSEVRSLRHRAGIKSAHPECENPVESNMRRNEPKNNNKAKTKP
jgi:hypothetical protein